MANSAAQAIRKEKRFKPDDVWIDDKWIEQTTRDNPPAIGFSMEDNDN